MNHREKQAIQAYERASQPKPQPPPVADALGCMGGQGRSAREIAEAGQLMIGVVVFGVSLLAVFGLAALIRLAWFAIK